MSRFDTSFARLDAAILATFADPVTYTPRGGSAYTLTGVLASGEPVQQGEKVYKTIWAPLASFTAGEPRNGDKVLIGAVTYRVGEPETEHLGGRTLPLSVTTP